ncbi:MULTISPECIES: helix-turn-helix transcriptional regulator [unclassified Pseudomonas]|uniref:helix-turn-helix transcriptional regulator n=1 Tax=unclassified Pseudomonas TaxID=196821 RepID=UPI0011BE2315|nr:MULTISPECIES: helix-turn-helix transcriptional regulator [unclassified Pseudomonas]
MKNFASNLIKIRSEQNITQQELGDAAGVSPSQISRYEAGQAMPRKTMLLKLAEALHVSPEALTGETDDRPSIPLYQGFSARLLDLRAQQKISLNTLAKMTGIPTSVLLDFELGDLSPSTEDLYELAKALGVEATALGGFEDGDETVRIQLEFDNEVEEPVVIAATKAAYLQFLETSEKFGMTPGEALSVYMHSLAEAASDPENAPAWAKQLIQELKLK